MSMNNTESRFELVSTFTGVIRNVGWVDTRKQAEYECLAKSHYYYIDRTDPKKELRY